jgi:ABC-type lipoprotein export system ATPase subunit
MNNYKMQARAIHKSYQNGAKRLDVLKNIDLAVKDNDFLAIQGP